MIPLLWLMNYQVICDLQEVVHIETDYKWKKKKLYTKALFTRCFNATEGVSLTLKELWKKHFNVPTALTSLTKPGGLCYHTTPDLKLGMEEASQNVSKNVTLKGLMHR